MNPITLPVAELKPALNGGLGKVINKSATLPVLSMIKVERTTDGWIALTGTDLDSFVTVRLEQPNPGQPASMLVPFGELQALSKTCGKQDLITVSPAEDKVLLEYPIGTQRTGKRCETIKVEEFPEIPRIKGDAIAIPESVRTSLQEAWECASTDKSRMVLNSALVDVSDSKCHCIVATDGRHLYSSNSFHLPVNSSVIIPTHRFLSWGEFNKDGEWRMKVREAVPEKEQPLVQISTRRWRFITKQIEGGQYPNWRMVIPKDAPKTTIEIEPAACESVVQTINRIPDHDSTHHKIGIAVEHGVLMLLGKAGADDDQFITVPIPGAKITGRDVRTYLNREFLTKALRFGLNTIAIEDALTPLKLTNGGRQMIIMPVRADHTPEPSPATPPPASSPTTANHNPPPPPAEPLKEETTMAETNGTTTGAKRADTTSEEPKPALELALAQLEIVRGDFRNALTGVNKLGDLLKQAQRENKLSSSVRQTLRQLRAVRI